MGLEQAIRLEPVIEDKEPVVTHVEEADGEADEEDDDDSEDNEDVVDEDLVSATITPIDEDTP